MQTTPRSARTSAQTQFSPNIENQGSVTIYNTKHILAIRKKNSECETVHNGKTGSNEIKHFSHSVYKTQWAEMQLEYSAQSNDLPAHLKCIQLHVQRENQRQRRFQLPLKTKVLALFTTLSTC